MIETVIIERLGHKGEGIARTAAGPVFVPYALPGETVRIQRDGDRGHLVAIEQPSPERTEPPCPLFERCGGCAMQHVPLAFSLEWKRGLVIEALRQRGLEAPVEACIDAHGEGRRRAVFHVRGEGKAMVVGFMEARSHRLVPIEHCPVLAPGLARAPQAARTLAQFLRQSKKPLDVQATATKAGLDIDVRGHGPISDRTRLDLVMAAQDLDLARLSLHGELIVERRPPFVTMGKAQVLPPPGGFLQATVAGEDALARLVEAAASGAKRVADLFSGCGPFALRLAERVPVHAVENSRPALAALEKAARHANGLKPVTTEARDLFRRPLLAHELAAYDAVVFDPPRAGAEEQAKALAASKVPTVVGVSCNPATFARDAKILIQNGYHLEKVTPVDQFRYGAHVELVALLRRGRV